MIKLLDPADEVFDFKEIFTTELKSIFKPAGYLQSALELEHRPEQEKMARRVGAAAQEQARRELQAQVGMLLQTREENTRVIRLLEQEVSDLQRAAAVAAAGGEVFTRSR